MPAAKRARAASEDVGSQPAAHRAGCGSAQTKKKRRPTSAAAAAAGGSSASCAGYVARPVKRPRSPAGEEHASASPSSRRRRSRGGRKAGKAAKGQFLIAYVIEEMVRDVEAAEELWPTLGGCAEHEPCDSYDDCGGCGGCYQDGRAGCRLCPLIASDAASMVRHVDVQLARDAVAVHRAERRFCDWAYRLPGLARLAPHPGCYQECVCGCCREAERMAAAGDDHHGCGNPECCRNHLEPRVIEQRRQHALNDRAQRRMDRSPAPSPGPRRTLSPATLRRLDASQEAEDDALGLMLCEHKPDGYLPPWASKCC
jgi:hypothetical protein